jgi:hypothetical protein
VPKILQVPTWRNSNLENFNPNFAKERKRQVEKIDRRKSSVEVDQDLPELEMRRVWGMGCKVLVVLF